MITALLSILIVGGLIFLGIMLIAMGFSFMVDLVGFFMGGLLILMGAGILLGLLGYAVGEFNFTSAPLKPEGCYQMQHERKWTGKTYITVETYTSIPCPA